MTCGLGKDSGVSSLCCGEAGFALPMGTGGRGEVEEDDAEDGKVGIDCVIGRGLARPIRDKAASSMERTCAVRGMAPAYNPGHAPL